MVYSDHAACLSILNTARPLEKLVCWALTIQEMDITIKHKPGRRNTNADALSRCLVGERQVSIEGQVSDENEVSTWSLVSVVKKLDKDEVPCGTDLKAVSKSQLKDLDMAAVIPYLQDGALP